MPPDNQSSSQVDSVTPETPVTQSSTDTSLPKLNEVSSSPVKETTQKSRDAQGRFFKEGEEKEPLPDVMLKVEHQDKRIGDIDNGEDKDPPLISFKITNPLTYIKKWWKRVIANEGIDLRFRVRPLTAIAIGVATVSVLTGTGFTIARFYFLPVVVPNVFLTKTSFTGTIQKSSTQSFLVGANNQIYTLKTTKNLTSLIGRQVIVEGKLNSKTNILEVNQVSALESAPKNNNFPIKVPKTSTSSSTPKSY